MNAKQSEAKKRLQQELRTKRQIVTALSDKGESEDGKYFFTEVEGVTVIIGPGGGYQIPAVRTYSETGRPGETALDAAVYADDFFRRQGKRGDYDTGHVGSIVGTDWRCNAPSCPCNKESDIGRFSRSVK
jgi:hypothetical protein